MWLIEGTFMLTILQKSPDFPKGNSEITGIDVTSTVNLVVTRFFLRNFRFNRYKDGFDESEYLRLRCKIFKELCYPSVIHQLKKDDYWYLLVSKEYVDLVKIQLGSMDTRVIIDDTSKSQLYEKINSIINIGKLPCVTRIDNDDTLGCDYIELLNRVSCRISEKYNYSFVIFPYGVQYDIRSSEISVMMYNDTHTFSVFYKHLSSEKMFPWIFDYSHATIFDNKFNFVICNTTLPMWSENLSGTNQANSKRESGLSLIKDQFLLGKLFPNFNLQ